MKKDYSGGKKRNMPIDQLNGESGTIAVSRTRMQKQTGDETKIQIRPFVTDVAHVSYALGRTINLGNYESANVKVMITMPCYMEEIVDTYKEVRKLVEQIIKEEVSEFFEEK
jgi:hypothetical protein